MFARDISLGRLPEWFWAILSLMFPDREGILDLLSSGLPRRLFVRACISDRGQYNLPSASLYLHCISFLEKMAGDDNVPWLDSVSYRRISDFLKIWCHARCNFPVVLLYPVIAYSSRKQLQTCVGISKHQAGLKFIAVITHFFRMICFIFAEN